MNEQATVHSHQIAFNLGEFTNSSLPLKTTHTHKKKQSKTNRWDLIHSFTVPFVELRFFFCFLLLHFSSFDKRMTVYFLKYMSIQHLCVCVGGLSLASHLRNFGKPEHQNAFFMPSFFYTAQFSRSVVSDTLWPHGLQRARLSCSSLIPKLAQTHILQVTDAIQPSHPLSSPSPPAFNLSQNRGFFKWNSSSHRVAKVLEFQLQHQSFQWIFRTDFFKDGLVGSPCCPKESQEFSPIPQFKSINSLALSFLYSPTLTSIHDYWKNHSFDQMDLCWQSNVSAF